MIWDIYQFLTQTIRLQIQKMMVNLYLLSWAVGLFVVGHYLFCKVVYIRIRKQRFIDCIKNYCFCCLVRIAREGRMALVLEEGVVVASEESRKGFESVWRIDEMGEHRHQNILQLLRVFRVHNMMNQYVSSHWLLLVKPKASFETIRDKEVSYYLKSIPKNSVSFQYRP